MEDSLEELGFVTFYETYLPQIYRYVRYRVGDTAMAEDLTANIFEKALRSWNKRRKPGSTAPWIFRIARNAVASYYQRRGRRKEVPLEEAQCSLVADHNPEEGILQTERSIRIREGIRTLSPREQDIIALKFANGLTNRAIAPLVGTSEGNVAVILHRAICKLRTYLEADQATLPQGRRIHV